MSLAALFGEVALVLGLLVTGARPAAAQDLVAASKGLSVASLDSTLAPVPLESWLASLRSIPASAITWEVNDCGEGGDRQHGPTCVEAILPLPGDSTAHLILIVVGADGAPSQPAVFDLSIGKGYSFTGFKTLREWASKVQAGLGGR
jgi:hypothetical protein